MSKLSIRPAVPEDAPALTELMTECGLRPNSEPAHMEWKYWRSRPDWPGPRSYVMARGADIQAHAAIVPGICLLGRADAVQRIRTVHVIDWAARPSAPGAGVMLMKYIGQTADALLAVGGSEQTLRLLPHLGFRELGAATCYVRPLHATRILTPSVHPASRLLPRFARSLLWTLQAPRNGVDGWNVRRISPGELACLVPVLPRPVGDMALFERGAELFEYALSCSIASMALYALERNGTPRGYFLLAFALRQARLADFWIDSEDPGDWRALIQCAVLQAKQHSRAAELAVWGSDAASSQRLRECGFHARDELRVQMLVPHHPQLLSAKLRVQMLDSDAAYRHAGRNEFWA
ncbi:MAG TPA: hypothetical protein VI653_13160 [Steroidobacteraceae bacterium]